MTDDTTDHDDPVDDQLPAPLSRKKLWLFRLIAMVVIPLLLLGGLELALRIVGYGYPTAYFVHAKGADVYSVNSQFGLRFFTPEMNRRAGPAYIAKDKVAGSYRIFVLGGSAAQGVPDPAYSFGEILKTMLSETYPDATFEVVPTAMTAINSHVVLPVARDCAKYEPDLFIVYMGNNEVVGPFGAGTVFDGFNSDLGVIRAKIASRKWKIIQLTSNIGHRMRAGSGTPKWESMAMFMDNHVPANDPRMAGVYSHFQSNLEDICKAAYSEGADTLVCTVGSNLQDCAPFASEHKAGLTAEQLAQWDQAYQAGIALAEAGEDAEALAAFQQAEAIDTDYAELRFRMAQCYRATGQDELARQAFVAARNLDVLRFRADTRINTIVRDVASSHQNEKVHLVDVEAAMAKPGPSGEARIAGSEFFYEHVHMTFEGNYQVAAALFPQVVDQLPEAIRSQSPNPQIPSLASCADAMGMNQAQRAQLLLYVLDMTARQPFLGQFDYDERRADMQREYDRLQRELELDENRPFGDPS